MKKIVLLLLICSIANAQESPFKYLKYENGEVLFDKVYMVDSLSASQVETLLAERLPSAKNVISISKGAESFSGQLEKCYIDYEKYGGKVMTTLMLLGYPLSASVTAYWKDGKYRIVVDRMQWITQITLMGTSASGANSATETFHPRKEWKTGKTSVNGGKYVEQYLADLFDFSKTKQKTDW